jgi:hypothetical protein
MAKYISADQSRNAGSKTLVSLHRNVLIVMPSEERPKQGDFIYAQPTELDDRRKRVSR